MVPLPDGTLTNSSRHPMYYRWRSMRNRCRDAPGCWASQYYWARGVRVCDRWQSFAAWLEDIGNELAEHPELEMDRIDPRGPYSPENVRLVSHRANMMAQDQVHKFDVPGFTRPLAPGEIAELVQLPAPVVYDRLRSIRRCGKPLTWSALAGTVRQGPHAGEKGDLSWLDPEHILALVRPHHTGG